MIRIHRLRLALRRPLDTAIGTISERILWLAEASDGPASGWGEAAPLPGFGGEAPEACELALERAAAGIEPTAATPCAQAAIDGARRDLAARVAARPLAGESGIVACNRLAQGDGEAISFPESTVKLKSCGDPVADAARLRGLHARAPRLRLRLDANGAWDRSGAHAFARLAGNLVEYVEQPLPRDDLVGCAELRRAGLRVALDESIRTGDDLAHAIALSACDAVVLKPGWLGGWDATADLVRLARLANLDVVLSSALGSVVGRAHAAHLALALGLPGPHGLLTGHLLQRDVAAAIEDATSFAVHGPGIGLRVLP
jgi:O-succinylbenzoate synthase